MIGTGNNIFNQRDEWTRRVDPAALVEEVADCAPGVEDHGGLATEAESDDGRGVCFGPLGEGKEGLLERELVQITYERERFWTRWEGEEVLSSALANEQNGNNVPQEECNC